MRRVRLLRDLSVHRTVAATAEAAHLTGPAVSQQLAALEKEVGMQLLVKQGRTLQLTAAGSLLVDHAEVILGGMAAAEADLEALRGGRGGLIRIAIFPSAARTLMPAVWRSLSDGGARGVDLRLRESEPDDATQAVRQREVDIAVVHSYTLLPRDLPPGCELHRLLDEPVHLAMHPQRASRHGLLPGQQVDLTQFADDDWLMPGPDSSCHEMTQRACGVAGFVPRAVALATDYSVLAALVAVDAGVALIPNMALPADAHELSLHRLIEPVTRSIYALTPTGAAGQPHIGRILDHLGRAADAVGRSELGS
ncbi:LysR family transcriptional regulator [Mycolicibacterium sp.]|uniref:LysR family transcriptional regulator n=1 Tax=Mycolicibacterium sp. TaxID=2320850 RepID=UPI0025DF7A8D|nr:LysR family transcriptional regulator [Mycolicibacterium sp.]